jgi:5-methyltetrahydropteroyltriglutamate--homocysteine methyltransferase
MKIKTEPIGSIPRPLELIEGMKAHAAGQINEVELDKLFEAALTDTLNASSHRLSGDHRW